MILVVFIVALSYNRSQLCGDSDLHRGLKVDVLSALLPLGLVS